MIENLFKLISFSQKFSNITRTVKLGERTHYESNAEHSHQLALIAWYIAEQLELNLDNEKIMRYAIVHDLVETYAGDTDPHLHKESFKASKKDREKEALQRIITEFPDFPALHESISQYEIHSDPESRLIYIVDKILPVINTHLSSHAYYIDADVSFEKWKAWLEEKIKNVDGRTLLGEDFLGELIAFFEKQENLFAE